MNKNMRTTQEKRKKLGFFAENIAARYLQERGYKIIERNYTKPWGEIDIICAKDSSIIFVEVKANDKDYGKEFAPETRVNRDKINKITRTARLYIQNISREDNVPWQIDIIAITFDRQNEKAKLAHFKNAYASFTT